MARIVLDQGDFTDGYRLRYDGSNYVDMKSTSAGYLHLSPSGGRTGLGTASPLKVVHVVVSDNGLTANHLGAATEDIPYVFVAESTDPVIALVGTNEGSHGAGLDLLEVVSGTLADRWTIVRRTSDAATDPSAIVFEYGTDDYYPNNDTLYTITKEGIHRLDVGAQTIVRWKNTLGTADTRAWDWRIATADGQLELRQVSDAGTTQAGLMVVERGGPVRFLQDSATGAKAVVKLEQSDVDEPFLHFKGTAASADLTRSIVDVGDVSSFTAAGYLMVEVTDDGNQITDQDYFLEIGSLS